MTTPARPPRRPIAVVPLQRTPPLAPIPPATFREPAYADGKPYEDTAGGPGRDDDQDDGA